MNNKLIYSLNNRFSFLLSRVVINSSQCRISKRQFRVLHHQVPPLIEANSGSFSRCHSHATNQGVTAKENEGIEVPTLQFDDVMFDQPVSHEDLMTTVKKYDSLAEQMDCLVKTLSLEPEDIKKRWQFCRTIEQLFKPFFNDFKIQMFGSSVNCFGFKGCDIDMTFETSAKLKDMSCYLERPDVPLVCEVLSGKISRQELSELPLREQLLFIHSVFLEYYKDSEVPAKFINAHVPLVRFYHDKYNLKCDLTMKNKVAYANTKLLYLFSQLDERVIPLMMTIRYWAKSVELIGKGLMFNTYTFSLLTVYFLQSRSPPILPTAEYVLSLSDKFDIDDMHDKSFLDLVNSIPPTENKQSVEELFKEFFFFYLYFDFTRVICPLKATAVARDDFFSKEENMRFRMNSICVQDPLCTTHNVADLVDYKHCRKFFAEIMRICMIFQDQYLHLKKIDLTHILEKPDEKSFRKLDHDKAITLSIPLPIADEPLTEQDVHAAAEKLLHILQDVLLFDCHTLNYDKIVESLQKQDKLIQKHRQEFQERTQTKQQRLEQAVPHLKNWRKRHQYVDIVKPKIDITPSLTEQFEKFYVTHQLLLCAQCHVSQNIWMGRDLVDPEQLSSSDFLAQERSISQFVAKQNALNFTDQNLKQFVFLFECYTNLLGPKELNVNFRPMQRMSFNPVLGIFLKEYVPYVMKKIHS